jgi:serine/threonine-protein kinase HipA
MRSILQISLENKVIGTLNILSQGSLFFAFNEAYLEDPNRPTLSQSFFEENGDIIPESKTTRIQLPPFFSNLLPEGHMREYLAKLGGIKPTNEFRLIELLGQDLPGAIVVTALEGKVPDYKQDNEQPYGKEEPYYFSLAGIQLKFSAIAEKHGGLTIPAHGVGGDWIVKLPAQNYANVPENEFAIMQLAGEIGIPVPETKLIALSDIGGLPEMGLLVGSQALAVKRFDRTSNGKRIHIEDFAQVYNIYPHHKYENVNYSNIANMIWILTGETGLVDFIRRLVFTIITGNGDMHLKNWSFIYKDGRTPELSPAYDLVSTIPYIPNDGLALNLGESKDIKTITVRNFEKLAKKAKIPGHLVLKTVRDTIDATYAAWDANYKQYNLPHNILERIQKHMQTIPLGAFR